MSEAVLGSTQQAAPGAAYFADDPAFFGGLPHEVQLQMDDGDQRYTLERRDDATGRPHYDLMVGDALLAHFEAADDGRLLRIALDHAPASPVGVTEIHDSRTVKDAIGVGGTGVSARIETGTTACMHGLGSDRWVRYALKVDGKGTLNLASSEATRTTSAWFEPDTPPVTPATPTDIPGPWTPAAATLD